MDLRKQILNDETRLFVHPFITANLLDERSSSFVFQINFRPLTFFVVRECFSAIERCVSASGECVQQRRVIRGISGIRKKISCSVCFFWTLVTRSWVFKLNASVHSVKRTCFLFFQEIFCVPIWSIRLCNMKSVEVLIEVAHEGFRSFTATGDVTFTPFTSSCVNAYISARVEDIKVQ